MWITPSTDTTRLTLELRELIENGVNLWDFDYPSFYQGEEKKAFEQKVIDHYYFRQIGQETVGRFLHCFRSKVREIMPYYIDLYKTDELFKAIDDPFKSYDLTEEFTQNTESTSEGSGSSTYQDSSSQEDTTTHQGSESQSQTGTSNKTHKFSDTPQGSVSNLDKYMSEASTDSDNNENTSTISNENTSTHNVSGSDSGSTSNESEASSTGKVTHSLHRYGNIGVQPLGDEIEKLRKAYINIDMMIIDELGDCFLKIY